MIRYVHIGSQINDCEDEFAFFDTTTDSFKEFRGEQVFDSVDWFKECYDGLEIERYLSLIPNNFPCKTTPKK